MFFAAAVLAATLTVEDYATMPTLASPQFSPDGKRIAYVLTRADLRRSAYDSDVWVTNADGTDDLQLTRSTSADYHPRWSPDGRWLAFLSDREGPTAVWMMNAGGGEAARLTDERGSVSSFEWAPDGKTVFFIMRDTATPEEERRTREKDDAHVVGERRRQTHLYAIDATTKAVRRLTRGNFSVLSAALSPDGKRLAIERGPGTGLDDLYYSDLFLVDAAGACDDNSCPAMTPLVVQPGRDRMPRFAPDGRSVAFLSTGGVFDWLREHPITVVNLADRKARIISQQYDRSADDFEWSPDGKALYFEGGYNTTSQLFTVNADGSGFRDLSRVEGVLSDVNFHWKSGRVAFVLQSLTAPPEVHVSDLKTFAPRQLTHHNDAYRNRALGETRLIRWKNPKDGLEVEGLLTLPIGYKQGQKVPLVTFVHGGPASHFDQSFLGYLGHVYAPQTMAAKGFAVLMPNPRGTGGYGSAFRQANRNDWGGMDWIDINAGIDKTIADGIADPERLGLMGWSYGGFMAAWAIGHSDRLKAISVGAPVVDLLSFHGTSDIRDFIPNYFRPADWKPAPPVDQAEPSTDASTLQAMKHVPLSLDLLREHSPLWHLRPTKAHVLIQHGEADDRVPLSQGTMLYRLLDELGVDVAMVTYPRTPHTAREPKLRMDVARRNVEFFLRSIRVTGNTP